MEKLSLSNAQWNLREVGGQGWVPVSLPGEVHVALLQAGKIPDPFEADNELQVQWVAERDWEFEGSIEVPEGLLKEDRVWLCFDGLDTLASVTLNDIELGNAENSFRPYAWDVKTNLHPGENRIRIVFNSPVRFAAGRQKETPLFSVSRSIPGGPYLRKAPCQWGWDWGPMLPPIGIWKDARLEAYSVAKLESVHLRQEHQFDGTVVISARAQVAQFAGEPLQLCLTLKDPAGKTFANSCTVLNGSAETMIEITEPVLWWPNGYGEQALYEAKVTLRKANETVLDIKNYRLGLRTIELRREKDEYGESFTFVVNGVPIFAKGSNWIPADSFPTRITRERLDQLLGDAARVHQNMIRVWGGGFYESEDFYDLCDEYGLLVWQDFIFACSVYPLDDPEFIENVHQEVIENVRRIRHRASLALWCGNNEMDWGLEMWGLKREDMRKYLDAYKAFFYETLPGWVGQLDPDTPYWFSSPTSGTPFENANSNEAGDTHYWEVWHGPKPFSAYREQFPRFMSEFGFQSLPPLKTIRTYAGEDHWNLTDYLIEHHQRSDFASALFMGQMALHFMIPVDFPSLVYMTMVLQAEGIRCGVEHWRRNMHRVSGVLYWQLDDCWPVASWSSLDYFGRWKALHYMSRRFFAPVLLSIEDDEDHAVMKVHLSNDLREEWRGRITWRLMRLDGEVLESGEIPVTAEPLSSILVFEEDFSGLTLEEKRETVFITQLVRDDEVLATQLGTFVRNKHLQLVDPQLKAYLRQDGNEAVLIEVEAGYLARFVELSLDDGDVVFSDNYFDVLPGETVRVTCPLPEGWSIDDVGRSLNVFSLYDSFA